MKKTKKKENSYDDQKLKLAFEYGLMLSMSAKSLKVKLTPELVARAEEAMIAEFPVHTPTELANEMNVILLAMLEPKN